LLIVKVLNKSCIYNFCLYFCGMDAENYCVAGRLRMLSRLLTSLYNEGYASEGVTLAPGASIAPAQRLADR
jgi:hypothetical protein